MLIFTLLKGLLVRFYPVFFILLLVFAWNCRKEDQQEVPQYVTDPSQLPTLKTDRPITKLDPSAVELVKDWPEYQKLSQLIEPYQEITLSDAKLNSAELSELAKQLKDSIRVKKLNVPSVRIRLNVLHNEALRLADMATIPTIGQQEVLDENNNLINAFSALNSKINNMQRQEMLNRELGDLIEEELLETPDTIPPKSRPVRQRPKPEDYDEE